MLEEKWLAEINENRIIGITKNYWWTWITENLLKAKMVILLLQ
jgi:hypothetical protein